MVQSVGRIGYQFTVDMDTDGCRCMTSSLVKTAARAADLASFAHNIYVARSNPVSFVHFVTNRCNARCDFCFIDFDDPRTRIGELTLDEIDRLSRTFGPNLKNVNLTGGEPFARKDVTDIARLYFRNTNIESIFITTNGSLPDRIDRFIDDLQAEFPDHKLIFSFSIDALGPKHDDIRKIKGLFENCLASYRLTQKAGDNVFGNISITVSADNADTAVDTYESLIEDHGVRAMTCVPVRDEGVYASPRQVKERVVAAYREVTGRIVRDMNSGRLQGYNAGTLQGRLMNRKNEIMYGLIADMYVDPKYTSPCHAGALFGVMAHNGDVYPCEILDRPLGNVRDFGLDWMALWNAQAAAETRRFIRETKCHCTYECAWSFNILGNYRYIPGMAGGALKTGG